ncbi:reverse transcriptase domain-containing protein [Tanacetum coccineum]
MVTPVEKRSSSKFCDFHNDKGHNTNKCMQLKKQIEELVRAGKLSHLIKEIKQGRDQTKNGKKEALAKDKSLTIYMIQSWHRTTRQKVTQSFAHVNEIMFPPLTTSKGTEGPLVIEAEIGGHMIHRMYVDEGSSTEVLYEHCFNLLRPEIKSQMVPATTSLTGFSGETIWPLGQLRLLVTTRDIDHSTKAWMNFMIVRSLSPYNGIIGRPGIREIRAVPSTAHGMLKFLVDGGIVTIRSTILIPANSTSEFPGSRSSNRRNAIRERTDGTMLTPEGKLGHIRMAAIRHDRSIAISSETLAQYPGRIYTCSTEEKGSGPKTRQSHPSRSAETSRSGDHERNLNKACPHDCYPLPEIDWKVESLYDYPFKCFLDANKGYHQIQMAESDEEKTAFYTSQGVYCYTKMPFGLKNAGATYQWLVDKAFNSQVGQNIEVYVDDLVIKSYTKSEMLRDVDETFRTPEGIKPCPDKTEAVLQLSSPRTIKEVQSLNGKLASLNRFLSKSAEKSLPLFKTLKKCIKKSDFHWTPEAEQAFKQLKQHLSELPLLVAPKPKEELIVYLSASYGAFTASNNEAEYEALIAGLRIAAQMGVHNLHVSVDSKLVANQVLGTYIAKEENMVKYLEKAKNLISSFASFSISQVPRSKNKKADALSKIASTSFAHLSKQVLVEVLKEKSIQENKVATVVEEGGPTWMTPIVEYLRDRTLPDDKKEASKLRIKAKQYELVEEVLYRRSFLTPWLRGSGKVKFLIVAMDYFTKWMEAKVVATITGNQLSDNPFKDWCEKLNIIQRFASVKHPQSNGLVESANRSLGEGIKARLGEGNKNWIEELPHVLWAHRTMIKSSHGDTPFSLTYGTEAVIPAEIDMPTYRTAAVDDVHNNEELRLNLDLLEERRERAAIREAKAKLKMTKYYNARVRGVAFRPGDFVYRSNEASHAMDGGKLGPKWEGPYEVTEALGDGAYRLRSLEELSFRERGTSPISRNVIFKLRHG